MADTSPINQTGTSQPWDLRHLAGSFDIVGDVHGCMTELGTLLGLLGYRLQRNGDTFHLSHPQGRVLVFCGDLVDRGPATPEVLRLAMDAHAAGTALCVPGNHDMKLAKALAGRQVRIGRGLAESLAQLQPHGLAFMERVSQFFSSLPSHLMLDDGRLVVVHAGLREDLHGVESKRTLAFALYGDTSGEIDAMGFPVRRQWAESYQGQALVVYGHTPIPDAQWIINTVCVDTGCVFGGKLTALRYPEREIVSVPAGRVYYPAAQPDMPDQTTPSNQEV